MTQDMQFKKIVAQYCDIAPEEMNNDMRFREDLGFSSVTLENGEQITIHVGYLSEQELRNMLKEMGLNE